MISPALFVLLGNGDGTFGEPIIFSLEYFGLLIYMIVADFNQDQLFDIALADGYGTSVTILLGNGDGSFIEGTKFFPEGCKYPSQIATADFDNDSYLDIVIACDGASNSSVYFGNADGLFLERIILHTERSTSAYSVAVTDFNGDNYTDIIIVGEKFRTVSVFLGYGNGSFDKEQDIVLSYLYGSAIYMSPVVNDFNRDGYLDIATVTMSSYAVDIFFGDGNGNFETCRIFSTEFYGGFTSIVTGDFNADGYPDIITTYEDPGGIHILLNRGQYNFFRINT